MAAEEKIVVSAGVLILFWGFFGFVAAVTERPPWFLTPCIAMLAYGYPFCMGFMNYYLSLGLACFGLAILWRGRGGFLVLGGVVAAGGGLGRPLGVFLLLGALAFCRGCADKPGWG